MPRVFICIRISPVSSGEVIGKAYGELVSQLELKEFMSVHSLSHGTWLSVLLCLIYTVPSVREGKDRQGSFTCLWYSCCEPPVLPGAVPCTLNLSWECLWWVTNFQDSDQRKKIKKVSLSSQQPVLSSFPPFTQCCKMKVCFNSSISTLLHALLSHT